MKDSTKQSRGTRKQSSITAEAKLIAVLERENASLQRANAKLLRMVELVMEERYYRPTVTGVRENVQTPGLPLDSLNDVTVFNEEADRELSNQQNERFSELQKLQDEHNDWRTKTGINADADTADAA